MHENGGIMALAGCHKQVLSLLKISQLDRVFTITDSVDAVRNYHRKNHPPKHHNKSPRWNWLTAYPAGNSGERWTGISIWPRS